MRDLEQAWREGRSVLAASNYLRALEAAGALPDQVPIVPPLDVAMAVLGTWRRDYATIRTASIGEHGAAVLVAFGVPVAAVVYEDEGGGIWSPEACDLAKPPGGHVRSNARAWLQSVLGVEAGESAEETTPARLADLLRLLPVAMFWPTCDRCLTARRTVERQRDGLDVCPACERAEATEGSDGSQHRDGGGR